MNVAILSNGSSDVRTSRLELIEDLISKKCEVYCFGIKGKVIHEYYNSNHINFISVKAYRKNLNPFREIGSIFDIKKKIKKNNIEAVIIYGIKNHAAMTIGAWLGGCKRILCVVNGTGNLFRFKSLKGKIIQAMAFPMLRIAYKLCSYVGFQNNDDKQLLLDKKILKDDKKAFITGGSGVNLTNFPVQALPKENRFLFLSRITPSKGINEYLIAAQVVKKLYPNAIFDVVGPIDTVTEQLDDSLLNKSISDKTVNYHGFTTDVSGWMGKCRFFVYPSYFEGLPRCVLQAMSTGRPIITTDAPGCRETVIDGKNGFLVEPKNAEALSEKIIWMIEHPKEVDQMANESRLLAEIKFDVKTVNNDILRHLFN